MPSARALLPLILTPLTLFAANGPEPASTSDDVELRARLARAENEIAELRTRLDSGKFPAPPANSHACDSHLNLALIADIVAGVSTAQDPGDSSPGTKLDTLQPGGHDPRRRGVSLQSLELAMDGEVDHLFRAEGSVSLHLDSRNESEVEPEELYAETLTLPGGFRIRAGLYFTEFGIANTRHPHEWEFITAPLVNARLLGAEGLRNPGAHVAWRTPDSEARWRSELIVGAQDPRGETAGGFLNAEGVRFSRRASRDESLRSADDMLWSARWTNDFVINDRGSLTHGLSTALGPNASGEGERTAILGSDLTYAWKTDPGERGRTLLSLRAEAMLRSTQLAAYRGDISDDPTAPDLADVPAETVRDWGWYAQANMNFAPRWTAGLRVEAVRPIGTADYERLRGDDPAREARWRVSPALTWFPGESSRIRLQYSYDKSRAFGEEHSVWLGFEILLGEHGEHESHERHP